MSITTAVAGSERAMLIDVVSYDVAIKLAEHGDTFSSRAEIRFRGKRIGALTAADLRARRVRRVTFNGQDLDRPDACVRDGRLPLPPLAADNVLVVEAEFDHVTAPEPERAAGLYRAVTDVGETVVFSRANPGGARRMYCCFDQVDLRGRFTVTIDAPAGWSCRSNGALAAAPERGAAGRWEFASTEPIAPYLVSLCAGDLTALPHPNTAGVSAPISGYAAPSAITPYTGLDPRLLDEPLRYYERRFGVRYPYGKVDVVFVPHHPPLAFGAPGLMIVRDTVLAARRDGRPGLYLPLVFAHEIAHSWFGGLVDVWRPEDTWLVEALTTYASRLAVEELVAGAAPWDAATSAKLPDHAYTPGAARVREAEALIGREAVVAGLGELMRRHAGGTVSAEDLVRCWSVAADRDLTDWAADRLVAPPDGADKRPAPVG